MHYDSSAATPMDGGRKTYERVFDSIKQYIVESGLKPGDHLPKEVDLCKELRVSRNTMREALKSLQKLGIIEARQKEGMIIREFNYDPILENMEYSLMINNQKMVDLINLRMTLEMAYLEEAIQRVTYDQILRLNQIVEGMDRKAESGVSLLEEDMAFHLEMYANVDNGLSRDLIQLFWKLLIKIQNQQDVDFDPKPYDTVEVHRRILKLFADRDLDACRRALSTHYHVRDRLRIYTLGSEEKTGAALPVSGEGRNPSLQCIMQQHAAQQPGLQRRIYEYLREHGQANHRQLFNALSGESCFAALSGVQISRKISNTLQSMRCAGHICAVGEKSGAIWRLTGSAEENT